MNLLWEALANAFEHDHAAARGEMNARALIVFKHESKLGNARAAQLFDLVKVEKKEGVDYPRSFEDYTITPLEVIRREVEKIALNKIEVNALI